MEERRLPASRSSCLSRRCDAIFCSPPTSAAALPPYCTQRPSADFATNRHPQCRNARGGLGTLPSWAVAASWCRHEATVDPRRQSRNARRREVWEQARGHVMIYRLVLGPLRPHLSALTHGLLLFVDYCICNCPACMSARPEAGESSMTCARDRLLELKAEQ
jgi:hypothetical protein